MPPGGYSTGLAEPGARSVQEVWDRGRRVTLTWFDPRFRPEPPHSDQAYGICFTGTGMIVPGCLRCRWRAVPEPARRRGRAAVIAVGPPCCLLVWRVVVGLVLFRVRLRGRRVLGWRRDGLDPPGRGHRGAPPLSD